MDEALAQTLAALDLTLRLALPIVGAALAVSLSIGLLQSLFRLQEPVINAIPRAVVTLLVLSVVAPWAGGELVRYTGRLLRALPELVP